MLPWTILDSIFFVPSKAEDSFIGPFEIDDLAFKGTGGS